MLKWLIRSRIAAFERAYDYDLAYARELLDADLSALLAFNKATTGLTKYRRDLPADAFFAARLVATMGEDCGPCTQLLVTMAEREGVAPATLRAIVARDDTALPEHVLLVVHFARAASAHDPAADGLRAELVRRWGPRALATVALALCAGRMFPTMKYALGHGHACRRVVVGAEPVAVPQAQP